MLRTCIAPLESIERLRALALRAQPLERLVDFLNVDSPKNDNEISLAMAEFILDFGEYLESL